MTDGGHPKTWTEVPRSEMFGSVIGAVDAARGWASDEGDYRYVAYVESVLFPFLEHEMHKAEEEE